jgi:hypothetical protein
MCDFSLQHAKSRDAQVADKLETRDFGRGTIGFASVDDHSKAYHDLTAVCVRPGTEIAFDKVPEIKSSWTMFSGPVLKTTSNVARFRQINLEEPMTHHDALEFADGVVIMLTRIAEGQAATVLQLPAAPKNAAEEAEQKRLPVTA